MSADWMTFIGRRTNRVLSAPSRVAANGAAPVSTPARKKRRRGPRFAGRLVPRLSVFRAEHKLGLFADRTRPQRGWCGWSKQVVQQVVSEAGEIADSSHDSSCQTEAPPWRPLVPGSRLARRNVRGGGKLGAGSRINNEAHRGTRRTLMSFCAVTGLPPRVAGL
jgi:hypothetical protein